MSRPSISVEELGKSYQIGLQSQHSTFREAIVNTIKAPLHRLRNPGGVGSRAESFWALRNVSFEIQPGEIIGIIGRNGAGKSTLLKVLSRITEPTEGRATVRGRMASLLEVGTGFHSELTGRENIYLNGSILGMRRSEIARKFDEIVAFAEVERFLDTQVKHYSSGMYVRLAFAVAAHLDPQILIVDEVLAVGDMAFQKKCLGRMQEVTKQGRTVLFVSHNVPAVQNLCTRCILLQKGELVLDGDPETVLEEYTRLTVGQTTTHQSLLHHQGRPTWAKTCMTAVRVYGEGDSEEFIKLGDDIVVEIAFELAEPISIINVGVRVKNHLNMPIFGIHIDTIPTEQPDRPVRSGRVTCRIPKIPLIPGTYNIDLFFGAIGVMMDEVMESCQFEVHPADIFGTGKLPPPVDGCIVWPVSWEILADEQTEMTSTREAVG